MPRPIRLFAVLIGFVVSPVSAQNNSMPERSRIRLQLAGGSGWTSGTLARSTADSLYLMTAHGGMVVPQSRVTRLEVSWGKKANTMGGLKHGALIGAAVGTVVGILALAAQDDNSYFDYGAEVVPISIAGFASTGALVGIGVGALMRTDRWERAGAGPPQVALLLAPGPEQTRIGLSARF